MPLLHPDAELSDESAREVMLETYPGQDVLTFDGDTTYQFERKVERATNEKLSGLRDSLTLFCNYNGVASVLYNPKQLARFIHDEAYLEIISQNHPGQGPGSYFDPEDEDHLSRMADELASAKLAGTAPSRVLDNLRRWEREEAVSS